MLTFTYYYYQNIFASPYEWSPFPNCVDWEGPTALVHNQHQCIHLFTQQLGGRSDKEIADEYFTRNSEVRQAQVALFVVFVVIYY